MTLQQFYSAWADLYQEHSNKPAEDRNSIMKAWCLEKMQESNDGTITLEAGLFEKLEAWYKLLSE